jgi:hypothetical protein
LNHRFSIHKAEKEELGSSNDLNRSLSSPSTSFILTLLGLNGCGIHLGEKSRQGLIQFRRLLGQLGG